VQQPVTTSSLHVEAPLLEGPEGSVVTLLNWMPGAQNAFWEGAIGTRERSLYQDRLGTKQDNSKKRVAFCVGGVTFSSNTSMLSVDVVLGFKPSKVESVEHGALTATPVPGRSGAVRVTLPLASADFLLYHK
jgi:hypothetical protein